VSPDRDHRRKTLTREAQFSHNTDVSFTPVVSQQDIPVGVDVPMGETES
jgi:hypothetical protein